MGRRRGALHTWRHGAGKVARRRAMDPELWRQCRHEAAHRWPLRAHAYQLARARGIYEQMGGTWQEELDEDHD